MSKQKLASALILLAGSIAYAGLSWNLTAPTVFNVANIGAPKTGDIAYDSNSHTFRGYDAASTWVDFGNVNPPNLSVRSVTTTDPASTADDVLLLSGPSFTETLFTAVGNTGKQIKLKHVGMSLTQQYTLATTSSETIGGVASGAYILYTNGETLTLVSDGSNWQILKHDTETGWNISTNPISATTTAPTKGLSRLTYSHGNVVETKCYGL